MKDQYGDESGAAHSFFLCSACVTISLIHSTITYLYSWQAIVEKPADIRRKVHSHWIHVRIRNVQYNLDFGISTFCEWLGRMWMRPRGWRIVFSHSPAVALIAPLFHCLVLTICVLQLLTTFLNISCIFCFQSVLYFLQNKLPCFWGYFINIFIVGISYFGN